MVNFFGDHRRIPSSRQKNTAGTSLIHGVWIRKIIYNWDLFVAMFDYQRVQRNKFVSFHWIGFTKNMTGKSHMAHEKSWCVKDAQFPTHVQWRLTQILQISICMYLYIYIYVYIIIYTYYPNRWVGWDPIVDGYIQIARKQFWTPLNRMVLDETTSDWDHKIFLFFNYERENKEIMKT